MHLTWKTLTCFLVIEAKRGKGIKPSNPCTLWQVTEISNFKQISVTSKPGKGGQDYRINEEKMLHSENTAKLFCIIIKYIEIIYDVFIYHLLE